MTWQTPGGDPPSDPETPPPDPAPPEPDTETARVPWEAAAATPPPPQPAQPTPPPAAPEDPPAARPVAPAPPPPGGGSVLWALPAAPAPQTAVSVTDGVVIAGVFSRIVAYSADTLLLLSLNLAVSGLLGLYDEGRDETLAFIVSVVLVAVDLLYFVGLWTSGWQATLGMRLLKLRVLGATSAGTLSINDAVLRWLALSGAISILTLVPGIGPYIGLIVVVWLLPLLFSTVTNRLHQGLHDRWARSVVVQPAPGGSGAAVVTCLVLVVLVGFVLPIVALALAGDQLQEILVQIGESI